MQDSDLGGRMKKYERSWQGILPPNSYVIARVDGRAFHTFTRDANRPFDAHLAMWMHSATTAVARQMPGFRLAYHQSDEVTFLFTDAESHQSQLWFDGKVQKLASIIASTFTAHFNLACRSSVQYAPPTNTDLEWVPSWPATFDCRVMTLPLADVPNMFVWRQQDWLRNSLQMLARHHFSEADLVGKRRADMHEMLHTVGVNWANDLHDEWKNGTYFHLDPESNDMVIVQQTLDYYEIAELAGIPVTRPVPATVALPVRQGSSLHESGCPKANPHDFSPDLVCTCRRTEGRW